MDQNKFNELSLLSVPLQVRANPESRNHTLMLAQAAAEVLTEQQLSHSDLVERYRSSPDEFAIKLGDLTEQGLAFARTGFQRWLANTDRATGAPSVQKFRLAFQKQWDKHHSKGKPV
jgi:hypothetical protein